MSLDDPDPPVHRISRPEDRERILAEALAHAEAQEEQYRVATSDQSSRGRWKVPTALALFVAAGILVLFPVRWSGSASPSQPSALDLDRGLRTALYLQAQQIEAYRLREGSLPHSLDDVGARFDGIRFVRSNTRVYQLVGRRADGSPLVYDSARPDSTFEAAAAPFTSSGTDVP